MDIQRCGRGLSSRANQCERKSVRTTASRLLGVCRASRVVVPARAAERCRPCQEGQAKNGEVNRPHREAFSNMLYQSPLPLDCSSEARKGIEHEIAEKKGLLPVQQQTDVWASARQSAKAVAELVA